MRRVILEGPGGIAMVDTEECGAPAAGEVVVEVAACGICGSDLHAYRGEHPLVVYPVTPGHECSGTVVLTGVGVDPALAGKAVAIEPSLYCGVCAQCRSGRYNICSELRVLGFQAPGAMCDRIAVPAHRLHLLPEGVGLVEGALAEPLAVGVHALARSGASKGQLLLVVGAGVIGLMVLTAAQAAGCRVVMVEGSAERVERALAFGADRAVTFAEAEAGALVGEAGDEGFGAVLECVGRPETLDLAVRAAPRGGVIVAVGVFPGDVPVPMDLVQDGELELRGTLMYRGEDFERALALLASGAVRADRFVTHRFPLEEVEAAYAVAGDPGSGSLKVMLEL